MPRLAVREFNNSIVHTETASSGIQTATSLELSTNDWAASFWVNYIALSTTDTVLYVDGGTGTYHDLIFFHNADDVIKSNAGGAAVNFNTKIDAIRNRWTHLLMTYDQSATELSLYVNSALDESKTLTVGAANGNLYLGARDTGSLPMGGFLTNFLFFTEHFDATKVSDLYYSQAYDRTNLDTELLFSEGSGVSIADTSGNGNNATIDGGLAWSSARPFAARTAITQARTAITQARTAVS